jgi:AraC-like DNA-binding protein
MMWRPRIAEVTMSPSVVIMGQDHMTTADATGELPGVYARLLIDVAQRWDIEPAVLLRDTPLTLEMLANPATRVDFRTLRTLVARVVEASGETGLAFYLGPQMRLSSHGFLGFAAMTASTVREALELAQKFSLTRTTAFSLHLNVEGETASIVLEERTPLGPMQELAVTAVFLCIVQIGGDLTGVKLRGMVDLKCAEPAHYARFAHTLPGAIRYEQPLHRIVFPASYLDLPLVTSDPAAMQLARAQCERELSQLAHGQFVGRVRSTLEDESGALRSLDDVAKRLHVSTRTLKRRLGENGTSFSGIVDEVRRQRAMLLLEDRGLGIGEIAHRLGYSDVANFTRAFKRWTGRSPVAFRG